MMYISISLESIVMLALLVFNGFVQCLFCSVFYFLDIFLELLPDVVLFYQITTCHVMM